MSDKILVAANGHAIRTAGGHAIYAPVVYAISYNLTEYTGSSSNPNIIALGGTATLTFTATSGYEFPDAVTVTGATYTWTKSTGTLALSNPTGDVSISIVAELTELCFTANTAGSTITAPKKFEYSTDRLTWSTWNNITNYYDHPDPDTTDGLYDWMEANISVSSTPYADYLEAYYMEGPDPDSIDDYLSEFYDWDSASTAKLSNIVIVAISSITLSTAGDKIYVRNGSVGTPASALGTFTMTGSIAASGNIMSLVDNTCSSITIPCEYCYQYMFSGCTSLTSAPALPAITLTDHCYENMFEDCTSLTTPPALPATTLSPYCYSSMFYGCTSLQVSDSQTSSATHAWKIPTSGTFTNTYSQSSMFTNCLGTRSSDDMAGAAGSSYTYYTQNEPV